MRSGLGEVPLILMDTAPAAVLGASYDPKVAAHWQEFGQVLVAIVGNFLTLTFRLGREEIEGVFEHHTGLLDLPELEGLILKLADGSLQHAAEAYLAEVGQKPSQAAIAVACPVDGDAIRLTNRAWAFSRSELQGVLGFERFAAYAGMPLPAALGTAGQDLRTGMLWAAGVVVAGAVVAPAGVVTGAETVVAGATLAGMVNF
jgi:hypothetical protein